jgi:predicted CXXCH cytochrome family protein
MRKIHTALFVSIALLCTAFTTFQERPVTGFDVIYPNNPKVVRKDNTMNVVFQTDPSIVGRVIVYALFDTTFSLTLPSKVKRVQLASEFSDSLPANLILKSVRLIITPWHQRPDTSTDIFPFVARVKGKNFFSGDTTKNTNRSYHLKDAVYGTFHLTGWIPVNIVTVDGRTAYCRDNIVAVPVCLVPGLNLIPYEVYSTQNTLLAFDSISAFYATEIDGSAPPEGFETQTFHIDAKKQLCVKCHATGEGAGAALNCASCHAAMARQKAVHAPVAGGDCSGCHEEKAGKGYPVAYAPDAESETCFNCHDEVAKAVKNQNPHAALMDGHCSKCHSPHGSPVTAQVRTRINDVCFTCHAEKAEGNHPIVFHPTGDKMELKNPNKELTCASCHNPHASENKKLLRFPGGPYSTCQKCHSK